MNTPVIRASSKQGTQVPPAATSHTLRTGSQVFDCCSCGSVIAAVVTKLQDSTVCAGMDCAATRSQSKAAKIQVVCTLVVPHGTYPRGTTSTTGTILKPNSLLYQVPDRICDVM